MKKNLRSIAWFTASILTSSLWPDVVVSVAGAAEDKLLIRTVDVDAGTGPAGVRATVMARSLTVDEKPFAPIGDSGVYETSPFECVAGLSFKAVPESKMVYIQTDEWKACSHDELVFEFSRYEYAGNIKMILDFDYGSYSTTSPLIASLGSKLVAAAKSSNFGDVPILATALTGEFKATGQDDFAKNAAIVAFQATNLALGIDDPLFFDTKQGNYVLTGDTVTAIRGIQVNNDFGKTGSLDWNTMRYISDRFGNSQANSIYDLKSELQ